LFPVDKSVYADATLLLYIFAQFIIFHPDRFGIFPVNKTTSTVKFIVPPDTRFVIYRERELSDE